VETEKSRVCILNTVRSSVDKSTAITYYISVVDPHHFDADPDPDLDSTYHPDAYPDADLDADLDPTFHPDGDPEQDPSLKKGSNP
jgi:hypothetical protein